MCVGQAASSAAVLLASGEPGRRGILPHARVLLHPPSTSSGRGALPDLEIQAEEIQRVRDEADEILGAHTGQDQAVLRADTSRDRIGVARRTVANALRASRRQDALSERAVLDVRRSTPDPARGVDAEHHVRWVLTHMRPADREIVLLLLTDGLTTVELGVVLGCSTNTASTRARRARERFAELYVRDDVEGPRRRVPAQGVLAGVLAAGDHTINHELDEGRP